MSPSEYEPTSDEEIAADVAEKKRIAKDLQDRRDRELTVVEENADGKNVLKTVDSLSKVSMGKRCRKFPAKTFEEKLTVYIHPRAHLSEPLVFSFPTGATLTRHQNTVYGLANGKDVLWFVLTCKRLRLTRVDGFGSEPKRRGVLHATQGARNAATAPTRI